MECETKGCSEPGDFYTVAWRAHGIYLCRKHAKENQGLLRQGRK